MNSDIASTLDERAGRAMTVEELADLLALDKKTIYRRIRQRQIPAFRIGTAVRCDPRRIAEWLRGIEIQVAA